MVPQCYSILFIHKVIPYGPLLSESEAHVKKYWKIFEHPYMLCLRVNENSLIPINSEMHAFECLMFSY